MIPTAIVAHPDRHVMANQLAEQVKAEAICWDFDSRGVSWNVFQAWKWLSKSSGQWGVVLEDDVTPCKDFHKNLYAALKNAPSPIVSLYLGRGRPPRYQQLIGRVIAQPVSYLTSPVLLSAQGYAMRMPLFRKYEALPYFYRHNPIDEAISKWAQREGHVISYCRQSLVNHRAGLTLIKDHGDGQGRDGKTALMEKDCDPSGADLPEIRKAWLMATHQTDWTQGSVALPLDCP